MQQSLCHLYFLTVLEHLSGRHYKSESMPSTLILYATSIQEQLKTARQRQEDSVLLWVELQAVVQLLLQQLALHLDPEDPSKLGDIHRICDDINRYSVLS